MLGARPGLICSGVEGDFSLATGKDSVLARSLVIAGMHPGRAGGPLRTSESRVSTAEIARPSQVPSFVPVAFLIVTVAVMPETSGMPGGILSIAIRTGTRCAKRTHV